MLREIRTLAHTLRYQEQSALIGQSVQINSIETVEADVHKALQGLIPSGCPLIGPQAKFMIRAIGKYGILDLTFLVPDTMLGSQFESGIALLKKLQFVQHREQTPDSTSDRSKRDDALFWLAELNNSIERNRSLLKLFLKTDPVKGMGQHLLGTLPHDYLPKVFVINDACVSNSHYVWLNKHFYF